MEDSDILSRISFGLKYKIVYKLHKTLGSSIGSILVEQCIVSTINQCTKNKHKM